MFRTRHFVSLLGLAALGLGMAALAEPPGHHHEIIRQAVHLSPVRSQALGSAAADFESSDSGQTWSSGNNTGAGSGQFVDGIFPPFQVLSNGSVEPGFEPVTAGEGALEFPTGDVAEGMHAGDVWVPIGNLNVVLDKNNVPHYLQIALLAPDILQPLNSTVTHSAIIHYVLPPGSTTPVLCNVVVAHSSTESNPGFEDKPWATYNPTTDTLYTSWTHFTPGDAESIIEVSRLVNASTVTSQNSSATWTSPVRLDQTGFTQGSNIEVDSAGDVFTQWEDVDANGNNTIDTARSTNDAQSFTDPTITIDPQTFAGTIASDQRIRIGPFPDGQSVLGLRQNQFPLMAIDNSTDAGSGQLVTVFQQANPNNPNSETVDGISVISDFDIFLGRTDPNTLELVGPGPDGSLVRVNQNNPRDFTDQFEPTVTVSSVDGSVHVLFLDRSQDPGSLNRGNESGNVQVGAAVCISTNGGATWTETHLSSPTTDPVEEPGDPTQVQLQGFDPVFGDYITIHSIATGDSTAVVGAYNLVDSGNTSIVDPVSVAYSFAQGVAGAMTNTNMRFHDGTATHSATCSEMSLAIAPGAQNLYASTNDFGDLNFNLLLGSPTPTPTPGSTSTGTTTGTLPGGIAVPPSSGGGGGGGCFVATAAYGSYLDSHVMSLRHFRDNVLEHSAPGRSFVAWYYDWSPAAAACIAPRPALRFVVRLGLTPLVESVEHPWAMLALLGGSGYLWRRKRRRMA